MTIAAKGGHLDNSAVARTFCCPWDAVAMATIGYIIYGRGHGLMDKAIG